MATYLGYVQGGVCRDTHAPTRDEDGEPIKPPAILKQLWVQAELANMGIDAWCGTAVTFKRQGKSRIADMIPRPYLPNYLLIEMSIDQFFQAASVNHLLPSFQMVPLGEMSSLRAWQEGVNEAHDNAIQIHADHIAEMAMLAESKASKAARKAAISKYLSEVAEYKAGQSIRATSGMFQHFPLWFERIVQEAHDDWPKIEAEVEVMGARRRVRLDPLDVKAG